MGSRKRLPLEEHDSSNGSMKRSKKYYEEEIEEIDMMETEDHDDSDHIDTDHFQDLAVDLKEYMNLKKKALESFEDGNLFEVVINLSKVIDINCYDADMYEKRGETYRRLNQHQPALQDAELLCILRPDYSESFVLKGRILSEMARSNKYWNTYAYNNDQAFLTLYDQAMSSFLQARELNPTPALRKHIESILPFLNHTAFISEEILLLIFSYLNPKDLSRAVSVCVRWKLIGQDNSLWRPLFMDKFQQSMCSSLKQKTLSWKQRYQNSVRKKHNRFQWP